VWVCKVFTAMKIQVVFWVVTPCSVVVNVSESYAASIFRVPTPKATV